MDGMVYVIWVFLALIPAFFAFRKGRNFFIWWAYGLLLPVAIIHVALLDRFGQRRKCGYCGLAVNAKFTHCPRCGYEFIDV